MSEFIHVNPQYISHAYINMINTNFKTGIIDKIEPVTSTNALKAAPTPDPYSSNFKETIGGPHRKEFLEIMSKEVKELRKHNTWSTNAYLSSNLLKEKQVIPLNWLFKKLKKNKWGTLQIQS